MNGQLYYYSMLWELWGLVGRLNHCGMHFSLLHNLFLPFHQEMSCFSVLWLITMVFSFITSPEKMLSAHGKNCETKNWVKTNKQTKKMRSRCFYEVELFNYSYLDMKQSSHWESWVKQNRKTRLGYMQRQTRATGEAERRTRSTDKGKRSQKGQHNRNGRAAGRRDAHSNSWVREVKNRVC